MDNPRKEERKKDIKPTNKVICSLFEEPSLEEREAEKTAREQETYKQNEERKVEYNFDFVNERPLQHPNSRFSNWEMVTGTNNENNQSVRTKCKLPR
jgi:hypothetical protein